MLITLPEPEEDERYKEAGIRKRRRWILGGSEEIIYNNITLLQKLEQNFFNYYYRVDYALRERIKGACLDSRVPAVRRLPQFFYRKLLELIILLNKKN